MVSYDKYLHQKSRVILEFEICDKLEFSSERLVVEDQSNEKVGVSAAEKKDQFCDDVEGGGREERPVL